MDSLFPYGLLCIKLWLDIIVLRTMYRTREATKGSKSVPLEIENLLYGWNLLNSLVMFFAVEATPVLFDNHVWFMTIMYDLLDMSSLPLEI